MGGVMFVGTLVIDLLLGDVRSRKEKRSVIRPVLAELRRLEVAVAEVGHRDLYRRSEIGVGVVGAEAEHLRRVLDRAEHLVARRSEIEVLSASSRIASHSDE